MTEYRVQIFREMRLDFGPIEADSPEAAIEIARKLNRPVSVEDCDGQSFAALVDIVGDEDYEHSRVIDFNEGPLFSFGVDDLAAIHEALCARARQVRQDRHVARFTAVAETVAKHLDSIAPASLPGLR